MPFFTCNLCLGKDPVCSLTYLLKEKSGNPVCLGLVSFFFKLHFTFHLDFIAGNFSERQRNQETWHVFT